jgi:tRNA-specific 2-thiouridylase
VVKGSDEFKEEVVDSWMSARLSGVKSNHCLSCHELRMRLLYQKMLDLDAQGMATGHMAKIFKNAVNNTVYVHSSNDEEHDQSSLLSRLPHEVLNKLILPLSDLQQKEIEKLRQEQVAYVAASRADTYDEYKKICGVIRGLNLADNIINDLVQRMNDE